jgi:general secretion pathway protein E
MIGQREGGVGGPGRVKRRLPQDGRIQVPSHGKVIDLRVSTVPTLHGESLVLRLLDKEQVTLEFTSLGFSPALQQALHRLLDLSHGILLATGPTGSGMACPGFR